MEPAQEDCFVVLVRVDRCRAVPPEVAEEPLCRCPSYAEARRVRQEYRNSGRECVIRFVGPAGGGD